MQTTSTPTNVIYNLKTEADAAKYLLAQMAADIGEDAEDRTTAVEGETGLIEAIDRALKAIQGEKILIAGIETVAAELAARKTRAATRIERMEDAILKVIAETGIGKQTRPLATVSTAKNADVLRITAEHDVPEDFWTKPEPKLDKVKIATALKEGKKVDGAVMGAPDRPLRLSLRWK